MRFVCLLCTLLLAATFALAADVNGKWRAEFTVSGAPVQHTFDFKTDGGKLTGTVASGSGEVPIHDGKIDGDNLSFHVMRRRSDGNDVKVGYKGKVVSNEIRLTMWFEDGRSADITAKKLH